jgi:predicted nuclease of restriction endonuclease-like (RecB) superfamily
MAKRKKPGKPSALPARKSRGSGAVPASSLLPAALYQRIEAIIRQARGQAFRSVNSAMVRAYWLIGREIIEEEQRGQARADYGTQLIAQLAVRLTADFGRGFTATNLRYMRLFYLAYPELLATEIHHAPRDESARTGQLNPNLSWTHYRVLTKVESPHARAFYEIEAVTNHWASRELERQINSLLYERLAKSRDKQGLMRLARKGQEIQTPEDAIKDPLVLEFLGLPESPRLVETELQTALLNNLQTFLLELGKGFAFVARQRRLTLEGDHFYVDLVFYHVILKCYILIDLKVAKLTHADLGQMQLYVNYFDETQLSPGDNPTVGLILCAAKNDLMVKYTLGKAKQIFASRYQLHLPTEQELATEIRRELRQAEHDT